MANPELIDAGDKLQAKYNIGLDSDADQKASAQISVVVEIDKKEALDEAIKQLAPKLPDWLKKIIGIG